MIYREGRDVGLFDTNRDAVEGGVAPDQVAYGPRLGFVDGLTTSFRATTEATNQLALDYDFVRKEQDQNRRIREAGGAAPATINDEADRSFPYASVARFYQSGGADDSTPGDSAAMAEALGKRNAQLQVLQKQYPQLGIQTYDQLWGSVRSEAQRVKETADRSSTSWGGAFGEFVGGALGSMSPRTAPLNFATLGLPVGELGLAGRTALQAGGAGAADALGQVTGGDERQQLLGVGDGSFSPGQVLEAAAGGAGGELAMTGLGKLLGAVISFLYILCTIFLVLYSTKIRFSM